MRRSFRSVQRLRSALRYAVVGVAGTALFVGAGALAQSPSPQPAFTLHKDAFGIAPGAGFFLNPAKLDRGLTDFRALGVHWIRSVIPWKNFQPNDPTRSTPAPRLFGGGVLAC